MTDAPRRVAVMGSSGSGKTTFSRALATKLGAAYLELDALHWGPNWTQADEAAFRAGVDRGTSGERWVADGNYARSRDIVLGRADTVVWLDLPLRVCLTRILRRTARRARTQEELWSGNREAWRRHFTRESLVWWLITTYREKRRRYEELFFRPDPEFPHLLVHRFRSSADAERWLGSLP